ncbi:putative metal-dependent HD superfamily phosphohydrolase [Allocatelliglobosispora scoriae]|uniref:Putative metal-dependent HD superfamily phosphohydrolase n=1 Tax=Allocatelliglobosispora scoriae TaxID=643052 RepID=A0A841BV70_9ACTN|nr:metal-dependent phosphohydrolase [Allocatelliglobosispora scoriae]MBB5870652.1 putative metal-dependent HD superfamily phosphohydrolase [Allocatelliglobosispora scoriae]
MGVTDAAFANAVREAGGHPTDAAVRAVHAELLARWSEPQRHYHTVDHLSSMLSLVEDPVVALAVWGHDVVYDPRATGDTNEERSAQLITGLLQRCAVPAAVVVEVARLVRLTAAHAVDPADDRGIALADADLAILAGPPAAYDRYVAAVRAEYAHVPDDLWRAGRGAVLQRLLALPRLFHRSPGLESPARANLTRELAGLAQDPRNS